MVAQVAACQDAADDTSDPESDEETDGSDASGALSADCQSALDAVQAAQDVVADRQDELEAALEDLGDADRRDCGGQGVDHYCGGAVHQHSDAESRESSGGGGSGGEVVSAATLARDQAAIDVARASLTRPKRSLEAAEMTAPFAGGVLSVSAATGDAVGASDVVIVMVGNGDTTATTTVTTDQIADVAKGQVARVTPTGALEPVEGTVTSIGLLPKSGTDTTAYPVTIELSDEVAAPEGSTASIALVTGTAAGVLTVPSSAISTVRGTTTTVLTDGEVVRTPVTVGVVGPARTEITTGLKAGQVVVLADLDVALPSGDGETTTLPGVRGGQGGQGGPGGQGGQGRAR